jgi:hypothetical protein
MAIAALLCVGATVFVAKPAKAADLGGDCCADLEERVADLEATTVRKGNKKVSVQIYGKVNYAAMWWDDGGEQNLYVVNNYNESTRTGQDRRRLGRWLPAGVGIPSRCFFVLESIQRQQPGKGQLDLTRHRGALVADVPRQQHRKFSSLSRPLTAFATGLKSKLHALILYAESRPCGIVRSRPA